LVEFAELSTGERLVLHDDRGWSGTISSYGPDGYVTEGVNRWEFETVDTRRR